jgi:trans-aconitate 2-methyltransferase
MSWNPDLYRKFQAERSAPFDDLLRLVEPGWRAESRPGVRVVDLGCGTGELTRRLADSLPGSSVLGIDSSQAMLDKAQALARPGLTFTLGDQAALFGTWDLIFSNAALQWSDDHPRLIARLLDRLAPGGQILVQVPSKHWHSSHRLILQTAGEEPFRTALGGYTRVFPLLQIDEYAQILFDAGAEAITVFEKVYAHVLEDADAALEWVSGTALVPYFERLGGAKEAFVEALRAKFRAAMPARPLFYPFRRILFSGRKPA